MHAVKAYQEVGEAVSTQGGGTHPNEGCSALLRGSWPSEGGDMRELPGLDKSQAVGKCNGAAFIGLVLTSFHHYPHSLKWLFVDPQTEPEGGHLEHSF